MPTISMFYGILIRVFFNDIERHHLPHIHAEYQGQVGVYAIEDGSLLSGACRLTSTSALWLGLKFIRITFLRIENLQLTVSSLLKLEDLINENRKSRCPA